MPSKRFYIAVLAVTLAALLVLGVPVLTPDAVYISNVVVGPNPMQPITANPDFNLGYQSWQYSVGHGSALNVITSAAYTGSHSLYIDVAPNDTATQLLYSNNQTLPIDLNQSMVFYTVLKDGGGVPGGELSRLDLILFISYKDVRPIIVLVTLGNVSVPQGMTLSRATPLGIEMYRYLQPSSSWQQFVLQLTTPRMISLYQQTLYLAYGINATGSTASDYFLTEFLVHPYNINCYIGELGIFSVGPAPVQVTVSKLTPLPASWLLKGLYVNSTQVNYGFQYGGLSDSYTFLLYIPMANGINLQFGAVTVLGYESVRSVNITSAPVAI